MELSMKEKQAVIQETYRRYQWPGKKDKTKIPDGVSQISGLNRKYLSRLLANRGKTAILNPGGKRVILKVASPQKPRKKRPAKHHLWCGGSIRSQSHPEVFRLHVRTTPFPP
jgi:hypothetical protein